MAYYADAKSTSGPIREEPKTVEENLKQRIINGNKQNIEIVLEEALGKY
jgi:cobalamin-dependent methionine synthase I